MPETTDTAGGGEAGTGTPAIAAATVILLRDDRAGLETLMLRRSAALAFGGMWVFPGGRVDPDDRAGLAPDDELGAARRAATREAHEEAGLVIAPGTLIPFSHWTPPAITPKRFTTWFFIGEAPAGDVVIDRGEIRDHAWLRPADALRRRDTGEIGLTPPTWVTLHELGRWSCVAEALAAARGRRPERFTTRAAVTPAGPVALWHGDAGYDDGDATKPGARHRLWMRDGTWCYERTG
jgi:8-oxo-dGTP pyrophosphatase MutT (NUDIX family)